MHSTQERLRAIISKIAMLKTLGLTHGDTLGGMLRGGTCDTIVTDVHRMVRGRVRVCTHRNCFVREVQLCRHTVKFPNLKVARILY